MKRFYISTLLFFLVVFTACNEYKKNHAFADKKWSVMMANATMQNYDSLVKTMDRPKWQYDIAMLARAVAKVSLYEKSDIYFNYMKNYMDYFYNEEGSIELYSVEEYNIDRIQPARNLIWLYEKTNDEKYRKSLELFVEQMKTHPRTSEGGFWHKKIYPYQMWLDGVYMASPFLAEYGRKFDQAFWFDEVGKQITLIYQKTRDPRTGLLYHAWDESKSQLWCNPATGQSKHFWSRAMGWYMMAIVDVLDFLPLEHPSRPKLISILNELSETILKVRDPKTNLWYQILDLGNKEGNYLEASGSAMFGYVFAKGAKNGYLNEKYLSEAQVIQKSIIEYLIVFDKNGLPILKNVCGGCGLGGNPYRDGSYEYYVTEQIVENDSKGVAPFILLSIELENL